MYSRRDLRIRKETHVFEKSVFEKRPMYSKRDLLCIRKEAYEGEFDNMKRGRGREREIREGERKREGERGSGRGEGVCVKEKV